MKIAEKIINYYKRQGLSKTFLKVLKSIGIKIGIVTVPPYEYIQNDIEKNLYRYLKKSSQQIKHIVIVGAHYGDEVKRMTELYPDCVFYLFEPFEKYFDHLNKRFNSNMRIKLFNLALSDKVGSLQFYDTNIEGSQSILKPGKFAKDNYNISVDKKIEVNSDLLDNVLDDIQIDCLWIDVQGAELQVLEGARKSLLKTKSVFIEVSIREGLYENGVTMNDLGQFLEKYNFTLVGLGTDHRNLTGNAFFMRVSGV